jgi:medium-chain acyl-[acyl-carrier-protein] hydrolase
MNKFGESSPTIILALLEETAADHCYSINHSLYDLMKQNIGWVLVSGVMKIERYPKYKENIIIRTWLSGYSAIKGIRENIIYDENFNIIGRAKGLWVFFDIKRRRPIQILDDIKEKWSFCNEESINYDIIKKIEAIDSAKYTKEFKVNRFDVDTNQHVNNIRYLQWALDSIPDEIIDNNYLHSIDGRFIAEAQYGDEITSFTDRYIRDNSLVHTVKTHNNKICATAITLWKARVK